MSIVNLEYLIRSSPISRTENSKILLYLKFISIILMKISKKKK